jgi:hypothetical protein
MKRLFLLTILTMTSLVFAKDKVKTVEITEIVSDSSQEKEMPSQFGVSGSVGGGHGAYSVSYRTVVLKAKVGDVKFRLTCSSEPYYSQWLGWQHPDCAVFYPGTYPAKLDGDKKMWVWGHSNPLLKDKGTWVDFYISPDPEATQGTRPDHP